MCYHCVTLHAWESILILQQGHQISLGTKYKKKDVAVKWEISCIFSQNKKGHTFGKKNNENKAFS